MSRCFFVFALLLGVLACANAATPQQQIDAAYGLIRRRLGDKYVAAFDLKIIGMSAKNTDVFELKDATSPYSVTISASSGVALASGLNYYIKYFCNGHFSWGVNGTGNQLNLPTPLPKIGTAVRIESPVQYRYSWNVCTFGYTMAFWSWERWEYEIDLNALNGINWPLSFVGQEYVWYKVWAALGMTEEEIQAEFSGPAFLAWQRMGNMRGWGGPLYKNWLEGQRQMQHQILDRQRSLGMTSILPCFSGHVPHAIKRIYPTANVTYATGWGDFEEPYCCNYLIDPTDSIFAPIAQSFTRAIIEEYGNDHIFQCDTFNEVNPQKTDLAYLGQTSKAVMDGIKAVDPQGKWLMQGWLFVYSPDNFWKDLNRVQAYLGGVSNDDMIILDLFSEASPQYMKLSNYYGKKWLWNMLLDFGGRRAMFGNLNVIGSAPVTAHTYSEGAMIGTGITPEAIENNPIMFDLMFEMGWRQDAVALESWVMNYVTRRYGCLSLTKAHDCPLAKQAWSLLYHSVYSSNAMSLGAINRRPAIDMDSDLSIDYTSQVKALRLMLKSAELEFGNVPPTTFNYDLTDLSGDVLNHFFHDVRNMLGSAYQRYQLDGIRNSSVAAEVKAVGAAALRLIKDFDSVLLTNGNYLLGPWIDMARAWGTNEQERASYEMNARNQITNWGPAPKGLDDYAAKNWQGLVGDYYYSRWNIFVTSLLSCVGVWPPTKDCPASYKGTFPAHYAKTLDDYEMGWSKAQNKYPSAASGDTVAVLNKLAIKYWEGSSAHYEEVKDTDAPYHDLLRSSATWTHDVTQMQLLCDLDPACVGFNSNGFLKTDVTSRHASKGCSLYIKKSAL
eukprot:TRINITY_DN436_c0_g1_i1.p1 TRINITY_DN436_c0_g1~~TRINITY_DN436_c0_g1_i1.p1  ORF type:complete len:837 (-),score=242.95 TRINITY_DN436_c0_g1_i1:239-2749(-)